MTQFASEAGDVICDERATSKVLRERILGFLETMQLEDNTEQDSERRGNLDFIARMIISCGSKGPIDTTDRLPLVSRILWDHFREDTEVMQLCFALLETVGLSSCAAALRDLQSRVRCMPDAFGPVDPACIKLPTTYNVEWVDTQDHLERVAKLIFESDVVGLDCEFAGYGKEPRVSLLQLATDTQCFLLDVQVLAKSTNSRHSFCMFVRRLFEASILKVAFQFDSDIALLQRMFTEKFGATKLVVNRLLDLRWSWHTEACICGLRGIVGDGVFDIDLCKAEQCSAWFRRPLRNSQLHYAAMDAWILLPCMRHLCNQKKAPHLHDLLLLRQKGSRPPQLTGSTKLESALAVHAANHGYTEMHDEMSLITCKLTIGGVGLLGQSLEDVLLALEGGASLEGLQITRSSLAACVVERLSRALERHSSLVFLNLAKNCIGDAGAKQLGLALKVNRSITSLDLAANEIGPVGTEQLAHGLQSNTSVTSFVFNNNNLGEAGASHLAAMLQDNQVLRSLEIASAGLGAGGAGNLCNGLGVNSSLSRLVLAGNRIGLAGCEHVSSMLVRNTKLEHLDLSGNGICDDGVTFIARALLANFVLKYLSLTRNSVTNAGADVLISTLSERSISMGLKLCGPVVTTDRLSRLAAVTISNG